MSFRHRVLNRYLEKVAEFELSLKSPEITGSGKSKALFKLAGEIGRKQIPRSRAKDFLGGIDPTGAYTFRYGVRDSAMPLKQQKARRRIGAAGGLIGGALTIPSAISGLMGLGRGLMMVGRGKGLGVIPREVWRGTKAPLSNIYHGIRAKRALKSLSAGTVLNKAQEKSLRQLAQNTSPLVARLGENVGGKMLSLIPGAKQLIPEMSSKLISSKLKGGLGGLALGGGITGLSSYYQYGQGGQLGKLLTPKQREQV